jgi:hypothetical protein
MKKIFDFIFGISAKQLALCLVTVFMLNQIISKWLLDWVLDVLRITSINGITFMFNLVGMLGTFLDILVIIIFVLLVKRLFGGKQ